MRAAASIQIDWRATSSTRALPATVVNGHGVSTAAMAAVTATTCQIVRVRREIDRSRYRGKLTSTVATTAATVAPATATSTATVASHLRKTRVNLLLGLLEDVDEVAGLLGVCDGDWLANDI